MSNIHTLDDRKKKGSNTNIQIYKPDNKKPKESNTNIQIHTLDDKKQKKEEKKNKKKDGKKSSSFDIGFERTQRRVDKFGNKWTAKQSQSLFGGQGMRLDWNRNDQLGNSNFSFRPNAWAEASEGNLFNPIPNAGLGTGSDLQYKGKDFSVRGGLNGGASVHDGFSFGGTVGGDYTFRDNNNQKSLKLGADVGYGIGGPSFGLNGTNYNSDGGSTSAGISLGPGMFGLNFRKTNFSNTNVERRVVRCIRMVEEDSSDEEEQCNTLRMVLKY